MKSKSDRIRDVLTALRETLRVRLGRVPACESARTADMSDSVVLNETNELNAVERDRLLLRLANVNAALMRVQDGIYGICPDCHEPIAPARLKLLPEAERCVICQMRLDTQIARGESA